MSQIVALAAAAVAAVLFTRRKTLKEDGKRIAAATKDSTAKLGQRVRGASESDGPESAVEDTADEVSQDSDGEEEVADEAEDEDVDDT